MPVLEFGEDVVKKLPYLTSSGKIFFTRVERKKGEEQKKYLYIKHGIGFTTNLIELLAELKKGRLTTVSYNFGVGGEIEIHLNDRGELEGRYLALHESTLDQFKRLIGIG